MEGITIQQILPGTKEYQQVYDLREDVLRQPIGLSLATEDLSKDQEDIILAALENGRVLGCLMLQHKDADSMKFRQMAVAADQQKKGIGNLLMSAAEDLCKGKGYNKVILHAREVAAGFYTKLGYSIKGDPFTEVGIPHYVMEKNI